MNTIAKGLAWALVIILTALAGQAGLIGGDAARTMLIVLPILAVVTLNRSRTCRLARNDQA
ncbi:hypothetical protein [Aurantiacibacter hainanensis]|uniref:hypothetical protein n=1 Tax=Aurantiacibacter hainanensis TaxID=3076114 RepID=UPI0030C6A4AA